MSERDLRAVARFLRMTPGLSSQVIGDLLGENCDHCRRLLLVYASTFEFGGASWLAWWPGCSLTSMISVVCCTCPKATMRQVEVSLCASHQPSCSGSRVQGQLGIVLAGSRLPCMRKNSGCSRS